MTWLLDRITKTWRAASAEQAADYIRSVMVGVGVDVVEVMVIVGEKKGDGPWFVDRKKNCHLSVLIDTQKLSLHLAPSNPANAFDRCHSDRKPPSPIVVSRTVAGFPWK